MMMDKNWRLQIKSRFSDRENIGQSAVRLQYWSDLPEADVNTLFPLISSEFGVDAGVLRPDDSLDLLVEPVATKNPLLWLAYQTASGDKQIELSYQLNQRLRRFGTESNWPSVLTVDDLMRAWCGLRPRSAEST